ncbi:hypothetical protein A2U01_0054150 [Trifolium medium]|uniref:Uncharacterized protein n=1 Tax=Trifolium medium TaxID=97028 RepID=A0A392RBJ5_9FABA|nr:hypothetical protein [Trifolium medium]
MGIENLQIPENAIEGFGMMLTENGGMIRTENGAIEWRSGMDE